MMKKVHFLIHDLNTWGGQDRSTLELIGRLDPDWEVGVVCYSVQGLNRARTVLQIIKPSIKRPAFLKIAWFHLATLFYAWRARRKGECVHMTGACALLADKIQVQFVHHEWCATLFAHPELNAKGSLLKSFYNRTLLLYNLFVEKLVYKPERQYLALSNRVKDELVRHFSIPPSQIEVIPHGVDYDFFRPLPSVEKILLKNEFLPAEYLALIDKKIILLVGEYQRKGLESAIAAFSKLPEAMRQEWVLMAVGGGNEQHYRELALHHQVPESVILLGHHQKVLPFYQMADLFLLPTHYEPFGLVIFEAMACGLPSVVSRCAGAYELAEEGVSIMGIENPSDVDEIATLLARLLPDESLRASLGDAGREVALKRGWDKVASEHQEWLKQ